LCRTRDRKATEVSVAGLAPHSLLLFDMRASKIKRVSLVIEGESNVVKRKYSRHDCNRGERRGRDGDCVCCLRFVAPHAVTAEAVAIPQRGIGGPLRPFCLTAKVIGHRRRRLGAVDFPLSSLSPKAA
jgi:hypothetical protein